MRRTTIAVLTALMMVMAIPAAFGQGPPEEVFEDNDGTWMCEGDGFVTDHCLNVRSQGKTWNIKVFDSRGPQESASTDPAADGRPCPQDDGADPGEPPTWWEYTDDVDGEGTSLYVCHHSGQQS